VRVSNAGQIWRISLRGTAHNDSVVDGRQGGEGRDAGGSGKVVSTHGDDRDSGVVATQRYFLVECSYVREKVWAPYDINMVPD